MPILCVLHCATHKVKRFVLSTQHNLTPSTASSLLNSIIKISSIVIALLLAAVLSMVVPHTAFAVDAGALGCGQGMASDA